MNDQSLTPTVVGRNWNAPKIAGLYLLIGALWIVFSDQRAAVVASNPAVLITLSTLKGLGYVVVTALFLYWLIRRHTAALRESEEQLRRVMDAVPALISYIDSDRRYRFNNHAYEEWFGQSRAEVQGKHVEQVLGATTYQAIAEYVEAALGGQAVTYEAEVPYKDGVTRFIHASYIPDLEANGQVKGFFALVNDITERKQADEALRESEERLRAIIDNAKGIVWVKDLDGRFLIVNRYLEDVLGQPQEQLVNRIVFDIFPPDLAEQYTRNDRKVLESGQSMEFEETTALGDEQHTYASVKFPLRDSKGRIYALGAICTDITERKQAEEALRRYELLAAHSRDIILFMRRDDGRILEANVAATQVYGYSREELLALAIHDLRTPETQALIAAQMAEADARGILFETVHRRKDGSTFPVEVSSQGATIGGTHTLMSVIRDVSERKQAEEALRRSQAVLAQAGHMAHLGAWELEFNSYEDMHANPLRWSDEVYRIFGYQSGEVEPSYPLFMEHVHPDDRQPIVDATQQAIAEQRPYQIEHRVVRPDGSERYILEHADITFDPQGRPLRMIGAVQDITERKRAEEAQAKLEEQLRQSQKMESIGRLAGGVAHDFNNLLTVIQGHCDLIQVQMSDADPLHKDVEHIQRAGQRAASLTRQLLAFSRKQMLAPVALDLNSLVSDLHQMLERLIGEDISLTTVLQPGLWPVTADPGQIEQVIMNLAINARDAMPSGGMLTIETSNVQLDESYARTHLEAPLGPCVLLAVSDTGHGMDEVTRARIFEPFFTTKEPGKGTGLGLSTVYGIVKQSGGDISVYSEPGQGAAFKIYLPARQSEAISLPAPHTQSVPHRGSETVLLVEDEEMVRDLVRTVLQAAGYTVLEASHGEAALSLSAQHAGRIDLLVTDVVMPHMGGRELAERLKALRPQIKVLFMSGYTDDTVVRHGVLAAEAEFLPKPFSPSVLASKVREVLDRA